MQVYWTGHDVDMEDPDELARAVLRVLP